MDTIRISNTEIVLFLLVFFRIGAVLLTSPFFGSKNIATKTRTLLSLTMAMVLTMATPYAPIMRGSVLLHLRNANSLLLVLAIFREILLGAAIGYTAQLAFVGIQLAGQLVGQGMGFGMMRTVDPSTRATVTVISQFNTVMATLIFLALHGHHHVLKGLAASFSSIPLASWGPSGPLMEHLGTVFTSVFTTALRLAIPIMAAVFLTKIALAIIARTMPQINIFVVGFPLQISVGLIAMAISLPLFVRVLQALFTSMRENVFLILDF